MIVVARITARDEHRDQVETILKGLVEKVQAEEGTLVYTLHRHQNDPNVFLFYEKYRDMDALVVHGGTDYFKAAMKEMTPLVAEKPVIEMYDEIAAILS
ncbi:MAG: putative quinol monooxygenase [Thermodesulfobacteriota bacterium]|nr:putative quinol monooxygenase [Thermodesulfobacteriota bacterium]